MADFGQRLQIGQDTGTRPVRRFGGGGPAGVRPGLGYGRAGGALPPGQDRQGGTFPGQGGGVAGGFPGQGGGVAGGFPGGAGGSPRIAPISLPPQGPPNPMPAFRNVDVANAGPGMTPPAATPATPAVVTAPAGTGGAGVMPAVPAQPGVAPLQGTGEMVAPAGAVNPVKPVNPALPQARPGMMNQPINYAAGLGGFQR